ncbi:hypothetical protein [Rheinheimera hassiensis]|uniref:hypothetical protein n=1 Tax=Rheinheimera hassiensis TaxID=1193627 RepID=UPI001F05A1EB|nr:hypothetical protein [Rheinheimera hassiensis]
MTNQTLEVTQDFAAQAAEPVIQSGKKAIKKPRPSRAEMVKRNLNPTTHLVNVQKTVKLPLSYASDILHYYLQTNQSLMLSAYERLAGLKRMLTKDKDLLAHVDEWVALNISICQKQLAEIASQREALADGYIVPEMNIPESYKTEFVASHPIAHKMIVVAEMVDEELSEVEALFFAGAIDDSQYATLREQAMVIIRGSVDRIFKATSPGTRTGGRFTPQLLAKWIREGNRLSMPDIPLIAQDDEKAVAAA